MSHSGGEKPIGKGDLVMVVRGCNPDVWGIPWRVRMVTASGVPITNCCYCGKSHLGLFAFSEGTFGNGHWSAPITDLKRLDPPSPAESTETPQEMSV